MTNCDYDVNTLQVGNLPHFYVDVLKQWQMTKDSTRRDPLPPPPRPLTCGAVIWNNRKILNS